MLEIVPLAAVATVQSRALLALLVLGGGVVLLLTALVQRPGGESGSAGHAFRLPFVQVAAASETGAEPTAATSDSDDGHTGTEPSTGHEAESAHDEAAASVDRGSFLGVDLNRVDLAAPRAVIVTIGLSAFVALALAIRPARLVQVAALAMGAGGVVVSSIESIDAGDELGIFVPLPLLAAILYCGAVVLAALALLESRTGDPRFE